MKILTDGFYSLIQSILDSNNKIRDWGEWSSSFDHVEELPQVATIFEGDTDELAFHELIDTLFKIENEMNRFKVEGKATTDARWHKSIEELAIVKTSEWPTKREIFLWEVVTKTKAIPTGDS